MRGLQAAITDLERPAFAGVEAMRGPDFLLSTKATAKTTAKTV